MRSAAGEARFLEIVLCFRARFSLCTTRFNESVTVGYRATVHMCSKEYVISKAYLPAVGWCKRLVSCNRACVHVQESSVEVNAR